MAFTLLKDQNTQKQPVKKTGKFTLLKDQNKQETELPSVQERAKKEREAVKQGLKPYFGTGLQPTTTVLPAIQKAVDKGLTFTPSQTITPVKPPTLKDTAISAGKGLANIFTSSSQAFGRTLGTAASVVDPEVNRQREETQRQNQAQIDNYLKMAKEEVNKVRKERFLKAAQNLANDSGLDIFNNPEYQKTAKQIYGEGLGTLTEAMVGNVATKTVQGAKAVAQTGLKQALKTGVKDIALNVTAPSIAYGIGSGMAQDKDLGGIVKEGLVSGAIGTGLGAGLQAVGGGIAKLASVKKGVIEVAPNIEPQVAKQAEELATKLKKAGIDKVITEDDLIKSQLKPFDEWLAGEVAPKKPTIPTKTYKETEALRKKIAFNTNLDDKTVKSIKAKNIGIDELKYDKDGNITLYREGDIKPGEVSSYSLTKKWKEQKPVIINKNDIIVNTNSSKLDDLYSKSYKGNELSTNKQVLDDYRNLEGEVLVKNPQIKPQEVAGEVLNTKTTKLPTKELSPLHQESKKYKSAEEFVKAQGNLKTIKTWLKSKFSTDGAYVDTPVIRREENITLYQGGSKEGRQFWTPNKKYAEQFGDVTEKTGSFYKIDNGNRVTDVYVEAPTKSQLTDIWKEANKPTLPKPVKPQEAITATLPKKTTKVSTTPKETPKNDLIAKLDASTKEQKGMYSLTEKADLNKRIVKPKVEALGKIKPDETVVFYQGTGKKGQYVNTKPEEIWHYNIDENLQVKKVKTSSLVSTGDKLKDEVGYRTLPRKVREVTKTELIKYVPEEKAVEDIAKDNTFTSRVFKRLQAENPELLAGDLKVERIRLQDESEKAVKLLKEDKQKLYDIAMGKESSLDLTSTSANITLAQRALDEGNNELASKLIKNRSIAQTRRGQEIVSEKASLTDNSASRYVKELLSQRLDEAGGKYTDNIKDITQKSKKERAISKIEKDVADLEVRVKAKKIKTSEALALLDKLTCLT